MEVATQMNAVVVGADRLGKLPDILKAHNIKINKHITGRDPAHQKKALSLPSGTDILVLLTDFLGHNVMRSFRNVAEKQNIPIVAHGYLTHDSWVMSRWHLCTHRYHFERVKV